MIFLPKKKIMVIKKIKNDFLNLRKNADDVTLAQIVGKTADEDPG